MFAVLAWLQILASKNPDESKPLMSVEQITKEPQSLLKDPRRVSEIPFGFLGSCELATSSSTSMHV